MHELDANTHRVVWQALTWQGEERFEIIYDENFIKATGNLAGETEEGELFALAYTVLLDPDWRVKTVDIQDDRTGKSLQLTHEKSRWFNAAGKHMPEFDGVEYIDMSLTPFTNTLPIMGEDFDEPGRHEIEVIFIDLPSFDMYRTNQFYTRLTPTAYRFEDGETDFESTIQTNEDGLVINYPPLFEGTVVGQEEEEE